MKIAVILIGLIAFLISCSSDKKTEKINPEKVDSIDWINFEWEGDSIGNQYFDKLAINIPFTIEGIPHEFKSQFDLGATSTMVYGNSFTPYMELYPEIVKKLDTTNRDYFLQGKKMGAFKKINFKLDNVLFENWDLVLFEGFGDTLTQDSIQTSSLKHIGTIGPDIFQEKFLIIDFVNARIASLDSLPQHYLENTKFVDAILDKGRIKIPVTIDGIEYHFMFDTGSSLFPLWISSNSSHLLSSPNAEFDTLSISSWGVSHDVYGTEINSEINIGNYSFDASKFKVYVDNREDYKTFFKRENILGIMGNAFFLDRTIIIDYKNERFGIVKSDK